ncbi:MAG: hypothetical protein HY365_03710 [Candidatus Aenigmarchaeota archaeon]|nr:hypothetical protein [Candidatus Aenigmarchaeota archaeon]
MKDLKFSFDDSRVDVKPFSALSEEARRLGDAQKRGYDEERCFLNLAEDGDLRGAAVKLAKEKRAPCLVVVGIGGSNLGTMAVQEAVKGDATVFYADAADPDSVNRLLKKTAPFFRRGDAVLNCVTKSGATTETLVNFETVLSAFRAGRAWKERVVVTTDRDSPLWARAAIEGFSLLEIPKRIAGRYSVLSPAGIFPLAFMGVDVHALAKGAADATKNFLNDRNSPPAVSASVGFRHMKEGKNVHDTFLFSPDLESVGMWGRQLTAESLGKEFDISGRLVNAGITPTVSLVQDLHSMVQLYLAGPRDRFTSFVHAGSSSDLIIPPSAPPWLAGQSYSRLTDALYGGTKEAFRKARRPFMEILLPDKTERSVGQYLHFKMLETVYLARLLNVNPFDQPAVESYKSEARRILGERK